MISPVKGRVSSEWSKNRVNPATGRRTSHAGIDIAAPVGTDVFAAFGGTVEEVRTNSYPGDPHLWEGLKSGNFVRIRNTDGARQWYGHLSDVNVKTGQKVVAGQKIGEVGATGKVTGPHLHLETWSNKLVGSHFNPRVLFDRYGIKPGSAPSKTSVVKPQASKPKPKPSAPKPSGSKPTDYANLIADGDFGKVSVRALQILMTAIGKYSRAIDGVAGKHTWIAVQEWLKDLGYYKGVVDGAFGSMSVRALQNFLQDKGHYPTSKFLVDGKFGKETKRAWQKYLNTQNGK